MKFPTVAVPPFTDTETASVDVGLVKTSAAPPDEPPPPELELPPDEPPPPPPELEPPLEDVIAGAVVVAGAAVEPLLCLADRPKRF